MFPWSDSTLIGAELNHFVSYFFACVLFLHVKCYLGKGKGHISAIMLEEMSSVPDISRQSFKIYG